jgi:chemotaxis methyl-accepting protein methylase
MLGRGKPADKPACSPAEQADFKKIAETLPTAETIRQNSLRARKVQKYKAMLKRITMGTSSNDDWKNYEQVSEDDKEEFLRALCAVTIQHQEIFRDPALSETSKASTKAWIDKLQAKIYSLE